MLLVSRPLAVVYAAWAALLCNKPCALCSLSSFHNCVQTRGSLHPANTLICEPFLAHNLLPYDDAGCFQPERCDRYMYTTYAGLHRPPLFSRLKDAVATNAGLLCPLHNHRIPQLRHPPNRRRRPAT